MLGYFRIIHRKESDQEKSRATLAKFLSQEEKEEAAEMRRRFDAANWRIFAESDTLRQRYPDQWVAMDAKKGVLAVADTEESLRRKVADLGYSLDDLAARRMDTKPSPRILIT